MKVAKKLCAVFLSALTAAASCSAVSAAAYYSTVDTEGNIISNCVGDNHIGTVYVYTPDWSDKYCRDYINSYVLLVEPTEKEAFLKEFSDAYRITELESGALCVVGTDANENFSYHDGASFENYSGWSYDEATAEIPKILQSGSVKQISLLSTYSEYDGANFPRFNQIEISGNGTFSASDFDWLDGFTCEIEDNVATLTPEHFFEDDIDKWDTFYSTSKTALENVGNITGVYWKMYERNDIASAYQLDTAAVYTAQPTGDIDGDGAVTPNDVYKTLLYAAQVGAGLENVSFTESGDTETPQLYNAADTDVESFFLDNSGTAETAAFAAADINGDGKIDEQDVYRILKYCAEEGAGLSPSWE